MEHSRCVPFVSEYSDCTEENQCTGCTRCTCTANAEWSCSRVVECPASDLLSTDDNSLDNALNLLYSELKNKDGNSPRYQAEEAAKSNEDVVLDKDDEIEQKIVALITRQKRGVSGDSENDTIEGPVIFHHTVDEMNEDTLKDTNNTGTLPAQKVVMPHLPKILRRTGAVLQSSKSSNLSSSNPLHIEYSQPQEYNHITDNKIDATTRGDGTDETIPQELLITNYTQKDKDKDLSKLVVNELKKGEEIIGSKNAPIMSNITFTPENDTLTAMAFIAGNLLNQLWNMEKETSEEIMANDDLKHQKITDLLDLFKEPLTYRQEAFLKNALQKLYEAVDRNKDISNISLCADIEEAKSILNEASNGTWERTEIKSPDAAFRAPIKCKKDDKIDENIKQKNVTKEAITKLNSVLGLIKKFEGINKYLNDLKRASKNDSLEKTPTLRSFHDSLNGTLSPGESESLNLYGSVLEKITKFLLPRKSSKRLVKKIKSHSILHKKTDNIKKKFKDMYNVDLSNQTLTDKDKLVLDYLLTIQKTPSCLLEEDYSLENVGPRSNIEGDILLNLSEFFKIKSFVDFLKVLDPAKYDKESQRQAPLKDVNNTHLRSADNVTLKTDRTTTTPLDITTAMKTITELSTEMTTIGMPKWKDTKEKLKSHLKSILDDLIELQKEKGIPTKEGGIRIADALPCIYNIINAGEENHNKIQVENTRRSSKETLTNVFDLLKKEMKTSNFRRNTEMSKQQIPKSGEVWKRVVKNLNEQEKRNSRRNSELVKPKTFDEIKVLIDNADLRESTTYKNYALFIETPPTERLILLKTLESELTHYLSILENIKVSFDHNISDKNGVIQDFVENAANNINLMEKVIKNINKTTEAKNNVGSSSTSKPSSRKKIKTEALKNRQLKSPFILSDSNKQMKLSRDEILNQLIKNRVRLYIKVKDTKGIDKNKDPIYNIAKNVLSSLERGNYKLARELYKIFVSAKEENPENTGKAPALLKPINSPRKAMPPLFDKEPLIQFEEPKPIQHLPIQDQMVKQLINIKHLKM